AMRCAVVTPEATVLDETVDFVAVPLYDGELGIAPKHSPLIGRLGYGELRVRAAGRTRSYYVDGGFVQVVGNAITILTNRAVAAEELDAEVAEEQLRAARSRPAHTPELMAIRDRLVAQARAQKRVAARRS
ncbi:MAG: ATP synthase F1 subunit epsilon, partial [Pirellulales bacterium]|nr:ATP synthase F1 subunit epsilon [Pirellulales bacterium]